MPRITMQEQLARQLLRGRFSRRRKVMTFDQILATPPVRLPAKYYRRKRHTRLSRGRA